jgi:hypothetical protein
VNDNAASPQPLPVDSRSAPALTGNYPGRTTRSRHSSQTLETVKHHLKPIWADSNGQRNTSVS